MKIFAHNFNSQSNSGPNKFTRQLFGQLEKNYNVSYTNQQQESDVEFCLIQQTAHKVKPMILRLDGIWFNSEQNYKEQNRIIEFSYKNSDAVVFQSNFNKTLTEIWFGAHKNAHVIHNAADKDLLSKANPNYWNDKLGKDTEVWSCASKWRPHKRLKDNVKYFLKYAPKDSILAIAGALHMDEAKEILSMDKRIHLLGDLDYMSLLSLYKKSSTFIHLAYLDHCPNVVVDAQAAGCNIICSSSGGTQEIVEKGIVIIEPEWNFKPCELYKPPALDFDHCKHKDTSINRNIKKCTERYYSVMKGIM